MSVSDLKNLQFFQDTTETRIVQDTIMPVVSRDTSISEVGQDSVSIARDSLVIRPFTPNEIQVLFDQSDRHEEAVDSISRNVTRSGILPAIDERPELKTMLDSEHVIFSPGRSDSAILPEFTMDLPQYSYREQEQADPVFIEDETETYKEGAGSDDMVLTQTAPEKELIGKEIKAVSNDWILGIILVSFVILAWIRLFYNKFLSPTFVAVLNQQASYNLFQDKSAVSARVSLGLNLIFYLNAGLYIYLAAIYLGLNIPGVTGFRAFALMPIILVVIFLIKYVIAALVGVISLTQKTYAEYIHNVFLFNKNLGLVLFPVILGMVYMSDRLLPLFFYTGIAFVVALYLLRLFRGLQIFIKEGVSIFYWILYLCALEFLPVFLFFKLSGLLVW